MGTVDSEWEMTDMTPATAFPQTSRVEGATTRE